MGEWAEQAFTRLRSYEGAEHERKQHYALTRHQIMGNAPQIWARLASMIKEEVDDFGERRPDYLRVVDFSFMEDDPQVQVISPIRFLHLQFDSNSPRLTYKVTETRGSGGVKEEVANGQFTFAVGADDDVWLIDNATALQVSLTDAMEKLLNYIA